MNARTEPEQAKTDATARPPLVRELLLVAGLLLVCKLGRQPATGHTREAFGNADRVWDLERAVHLPGEGAVQHLLLHGDTLIRTANTYCATVHLPVTAAALVVRLTFPLAPPRSLAATGLVDTGQVYGPSVYGSPEIHLPRRTATTAGRGVGKPVPAARAEEGIAEGAVLVGAGR